MKHLGILLLFPLLFLALFSISSQPAGSLDPSYGTNGRRIINYSGSVIETLGGILTQSDGKVVVSGTTTLNNGLTLVARYGPNGELDPSFANGGVRFINQGSGLGFGLALQSDDKILVTGKSGDNLYVARLLPDGEFDVTFGSNGIATLTLEGTSIQALSLVVQPDGKIALAGNLRYTPEPKRYFYFSRLLANGTLDVDFGTGGSVIVDGVNSTAGLNRLIVLEDGKLAATGRIRQNGTNVVTIRLLADGTPDPSFGENGLVNTSIGNSDDAGWDILPAENGGLMIGARTINTSTTHTDYALIKYLVDGNLDSSFGDDGIVTTNPPGSSGSLFRILPQPGGKIIAGGATSINVGNRGYDLTLIRYLADGSLDLSFGEDGISFTDFGNTQDWLWDLSLDDNGNILGAGRTNLLSDNFDALTVRFFGSDQPDFYLDAEVLFGAVCSTMPVEDTLRITTIGGFEENLTVTVNNLPAGAVIGPEFPVSVSPPFDVDFTLDFVNTPSGDYVITFSASNGIRTKSINYPVSVVSGALVAPELLAPEDGLVTENSELFFDWSDSDIEVIDRIEVSTSPSFSGPLIVDREAVTSSFYSNQVLEPGIYYWRVRSELCGEAAYSETSTFQLLTRTCVDRASTDGALFITNAGLDTVVSSLIISEPFPAAMENVRLFVATGHVRIGDLSMTLRHPSGSEFLLLDRPGFPATSTGCNERGISVTFTQGTSNTAADLENTCETGGLFSIEGDFQAAWGNMNNIFVEGETGEWELIVIDHRPNAGGFLNGWGFEVCTPPVVLAELMVSNATLSLLQNTTATITENQLTASASDSDVELLYVLRELPLYGEVQRTGQNLQIGDTIFAADLISGNLTYTHLADQLLPDEFYFDVVGSDGSWLPNQLFTIEVLMTSSVIESQLFSEVRISPNPTTTTIHISGLPADVSILELKLFNSQGEVVLRKKTGIDLSVDGLPAGVYWLQGSTGLGAFVRKISVI